MDCERLLERFIRYARIETTANDQTDEYPSSQGQWELGALLVQELQAAGVADARQNEFGLILATISANTASDVPVIAFNAHLDTSPETSGKGVDPQVIRQYRGGDIPLPRGTNQIIRVTENSELESLRGKTLITSDGTTLLGADDKAGIAIIMELVDVLAQTPSIPHGPLRILFTCDEEIGRGANHVDLAELGASACYTLDGPAAGQIDVETFSADLAKLRLRGVNIHPSIGKGRLVNALKAAGSLLEKMPRQRLSPETSSGREGFLHPYSIRGGVAEVELSILLRDFDTHNLAAQAEVLRVAAKQTEREFPGVHIDLEISKQYRNLGDGLSRAPHVVAMAEAAYRRLGLNVRRSIIRGGTDGSMLTERGLPTPNLSSGQHNPHSTLEWACLDEMAEAVRVVTELIQVWADDAPRQIQ